ncbi:hypothetical protein HYDPIDRAFT_110077 [Hydnomerulius pinastri MD-312]|nr:hypothetical protein HYDPIDRAFT_110077 [Hydnomerulius pinastri MD-312]
MGLRKFLSLLPGFLFGTLPVDTGHRRCTNGVRSTLVETRGARPPYGGVRVDKLLQSQRQLIIFGATMVRERIAGSDRSSVLSI